MPEAAVAVLYRDAALADGRSDRLRLGVSILVEDDRISWIRPADDEAAVTRAGCRDPGSARRPGSTPSSTASSSTPMSRERWRPPDARWSRP
jgi:hypothetical protein